MQDDLTRLLQLDPGPHTRALVAEHLLGCRTRRRDRADGRTGHRPRDLLPVDADEARTGVALARILEIEGAIDERLAAMRSLADRHRGSVYVHLQAAAMYERAGLGADSAREQEQARLLEPGPPQSRTPAIELQGLGSFLDDVGRLMHDLDQPGPTPTGRRRPVMPPRRQ
ncbi:MAG: hypothetical protein IPK26_28505 [Planctomycetes bacterium]|nr:hypothetical protein [Planctomycetota bacterium]